MVILIGGQIEFESFFFQQGLIHPYVLAICF